MSMRTAAVSNFWRCDRFLMWFTSPATFSRLFPPPLSNGITDTEFASKWSKWFLLMIEVTEDAVDVNGDDTTVIDDATTDETLEEDTAFKFDDILLNSVRAATAVRSESIRDCCVGIECLCCCLIWWIGNDVSADLATSPATATFAIELVRSSSSFAADLASTSCKRVLDKTLHWVTERERETIIHHRYH